VQAVELWKRVIKVDPAFSSAYPNLADALEDLGRFDEAKKIRDLAPGQKRIRAVTPVETTPAGDFDNGEIPLQYKPKNR
jgi:tetratricopeptide (TPR) repeat protein